MRVSVILQVSTRVGELMSTALMKAAWHGHIEVVQLLIDGGSDINVFNPVRYLGRGRGRGREKFYVKMLL